MPTSALLAALTASASWAIASIAISRVLERGVVTPAAANLFKNALAGSCFFVAALVMGGRWPVGQAWGWLFLSGFLGFSVADTLYFAAFRRCGVQTAATIVLLNVPIATMLAVPLAGDPIERQLIPFMVVVLIGVLLVVLDRRVESSPRPSDPASASGGPRRVSRADYGLGVLLALGAALAIGTAVPIGRGRFDEVGVAPGGLVRLVGGALGAFPVALLSGFARGTTPIREVSRLFEPVFRAPGPASVWGRVCLFGVGTAVAGLIPYHYALRELPGGISAVLFASTPLFTLPLALLIGQRVGKGAVIGTVVGFAGVAGLLLAGTGAARLQGVTLQVTRLAFESPDSARFPRFVGLMAGDGAQPGPAEAAPPPVVATSVQSPDADGQGARLVLLSGDDPSAPSERTLIDEDESSAIGRGAFYVNWADVPGAARLATGGLIVAHLERIDESATYAYGIRLALEEDGPPARDLGWLHDDASAVEHGFVSLIPESDGGALAVWLDGRATGAPDAATSDADVGATAPAGMQLRARTIRADGERQDEIVLDARVCDCCPTDAVELDDGTAVVVYRDRSAEEVRDIWSVRRPAGSAGWSKPRPVSEDGWRIEGCPVNGPAIAASGKHIAVAWFTQAGEEGDPQVRVAFSSDRGRSFGRVRTIVRGATLGRVAIAPLGGDRFAVAHLAQVESAPGGSNSGAAWRAAVVAPGAEPSAFARIAEVDSGRRSGSLELSATGESVIHAVWTSAAGIEAARLELAVLDPGPDAGSEAGSDVGSDAGPDAGPGAGSD